MWSVFSTIDSTAEFKPRYEDQTHGVLHTYIEEDSELPKTRDCQASQINSVGIIENNPA